MAQVMDSPATKTRSRKLITGIGRLFEWLVFFGLAASSVSTLLYADQFRIGMLLTYTPRVVWLVIAALLLVFYVCNRQKYRIVFVILFSVLLVRDLPIGGGSSQVDECLTLLSFNFGNEVEQTHRIAKLCDEENVDVLIIQEVSPANRSRFVAALPDFTFCWPDESVEFEHSEPWVFSCLTGVRSELLADEASTEVFTGITGYRTFAVQTEIAGRSVHLVNVHSTKPVRLYYGLADFVSYAASKAARHRVERDRLACWISSHDDAPVLVAGDFNAPANSYNLRFADLHHAFGDSGTGVHLTFPRSCPMIGIDHVLGSERVSFVSCKIIDAGFSDHRHQVTRFQIK